MKYAKVCYLNQVVAIRKGSSDLARQRDSLYLDRCGDTGLGYRAIAEVGVRVAQNWRCMPFSLCYARV